MSDTFTLDDHLRRIAALLATAESFADQGNDAAVDAYVQKAHALQSRYEIDNEMLAAHAEGKVAPQKVIERKIIITRRHGSRFQDLANVIAKASGCTGYFGGGEKTFHGNVSPYNYVVFGYPADVEYVEHLFHSLARQAETELSRAKATHKRNQAQLPKYMRENGKTFAVAFLHGFTGKVGSRLRAARSEAEKEARRVEFRKVNEGFAETMTDAQVDDLVAGRAGHVGSVGQSVALVLAAKEKRIDDEMRSRVQLHNRSSASTNLGSGRGFAAGQAAGNKASITRGGVGGGKVKGALDG